MIPTFIGIWALITYMEFFNPEADDKMGLVGYLILSAIFLSLAVMMWLMTGGKLPAYHIHEDETNKK
jgi:hypothetical protein